MLNAVPSVINRWYERRRGSHFSGRSDVASGNHIGLCSMNDKKFIVSTDQAPAAIGPYSQAVGYGGLLFLSGQIALDPSSGELINADVMEETAQIMSNLAEVLRCAGLDFTHVLKTTIFLRNMTDFQAVNEIYGGFFHGDPPARATVEVSRLPKDVSVEIDMIAAAPDGAFKSTEPPEAARARDDREAQEESAETAEEPPAS